MYRSLIVVFAAMFAGMALTGCATAPKTESEKDALASEAESTLKAMEAADPTLRDFLQKSTGYAVFPNVGKGGLVVGGASGRGALYRTNGKMLGYARMEQATVGAQIGGQSFAEVIAFENEDALTRFTSNRLELTAQVSAVALKSGAAASAKYTNGVAVFTHVKGGLMAEAALGGQRFTFTPAELPR